jgi:hypothetical protein
MLHQFFAVGHVRRYTRRKAHYDDEVHYCVRKLRDLVEVVVPFMDEHLPPSYKHQQYERWRAKLLDHWAHRARRRPGCSVQGCELAARAEGLGRGHY